MTRNQRLLMLVAIIAVAFVLLACGGSTLTMTDAELLEWLATP